MWNVAELSATTLRLGPIGLNLMDGVVPDSQLRGDMISPLYEELVGRRQNTLERAYQVGAEPVFKLGVRADPGVPWRTFMQVVYTAGQAQYEAICLLGEVDPATGRVDEFCVEMPTIGGPDTPMPPAVLASAGEISIRHADRRVDVPCAPQCDASAVSDALTGAAMVAVVHSEPTATLADGLALADLVKGATGARIVVASLGLADPTPLSLDGFILGDPADRTPQMEGSIRELLESQQTGE